MRAAGRPLSSGRCSCPAPRGCPPADGSSCSKIYFLLCADATPKAQPPQGKGRLQAESLVRHHTQTRNTSKRPRGPGVFNDVFPHPVGLLPTQGKTATKPQNLCPCHGPLRAGFIQSSRGSRPRFAASRSVHTVLCCLYRPCGAWLTDPSPLHPVWITVSHLVRGSKARPIQPRAVPDRHPRDMGTLSPFCAPRPGGCIAAFLQGCVGSAPTPGEKVLIGGAPWGKLFRPLQRCLGCGTRLVGTRPERPLAVGCGLPAAPARPEAERPVCLLHPQPQAVPQWPLLLSAPPSTSAWEAPLECSYFTKTRVLEGHICKAQGSIAFLGGPG